MKVIVASHPSSLRHDTGPFHPEKPERVEAVRRGISESGLEVVDIEAPRIERSELALAHDPGYIEMIESYSSLGGGALDMDTAVSEDSWEAALRSAGAVRVLIDELEKGDDATGFALCRPPGHHALSDRAMGFCLFNNVAISAKLLRARGERVAILDWDVHHGNGTQAIVADDPGILFVSVHQSRHYPHQGLLEDIETGSKGTVVNIPLPRGTAGDVYRRAWAELAIPVAAQFQPDWVLVSSGYDAHVDDPLADFRLTPGDFGWIASRVSEVISPSRIVLALEGGYDLEGLRASAAATVLGVAGIELDFEEPRRSEGEGAKAALEAATEAIRAHWAV
jgi:acetoin utilization deacetylase AcuC-like enzyme